MTRGTESTGPAQLRVQIDSLPVVVNGCVDVDSSALFVVLVPENFNLNVCPPLRINSTFISFPITQYNLNYLLS